MTLLAAARAQALTALADPAVSTVRILLLRDRLTRGEFNGRSCKSCFFGILGGETDEGYNSIRRNLGMETPRYQAINNPIEHFCHLIYRGSPRELQFALMLIDWIDAELNRRRTSTAVPVSVSEPEINEALDSVEADRLIAETRFVEQVHEFR